MFYAAVGWKRSRIVGRHSLNRQPQCPRATRRRSANRSPSRPRHEIGPRLPHQVIDALRQRIKRRPRLSVQCLFNDREDLKLLCLARGEGRANIDIWYTKGSRPDNDLHYKIVDGGKFVHLSSHAHGASERRYVLRKAEPWWAIPTRRRISAQYLRHFSHGRAYAQRAT